MRINPLMNYDELLENAKEMAQLLKLIAHPDRLMVLCHLVEGEMNAGELAGQSSLSGSAFSQHLALLRKANIINARKEGLHIFYSLKDERIRELMKTMYEVCQK